MSPEQMSPFDDFPPAPVPVTNQTFWISHDFLYRRQRTPGPKIRVILSSARGFGKKKKTERKKTRRGVGDTEHANGNKYHMRNRLWCLLTSLTYLSGICKVQKFLCHQKDFIFVQISNLIFLAPFWTSTNLSVPWHWKNIISEYLNLYAMKRQRFSHLLLPPHTPLSMSVFWNMCT